MKYTRESLEAMGLNEDQIFNILKNQSDEEVQEAAKVIPFDPTTARVTSIADIREYSKGQVVQLPDFAEGQPFIARVRRPSMLMLTKTGKIPNSLMTQASDLFAKGTGSMIGQDKQTIDELFEVIDVIIEAALVEPSYTEIKNAGLSLTDDQMMALFSYTQKGVKALESFR